MICAFTEMHYDVCASGIRYFASIEHINKQSSIDKQKYFSTDEFHRQSSIDTPGILSIDMIQLTKSSGLSIDNHNSILNLGNDNGIESSIEKCLVNYILVN